MSRCGKHPVSQLKNGQDSRHPYEPFFRVAVNEVRGQEGVSCVSKVFVTLPQTTVTLLKGRHVLESCSLPCVPGCRLQLQPVLKLCGFCGNYDGDLSNDNLKLDGSPAEDVLEPGSSWQMAEDEAKEACLPHLLGPTFFESCITDMCNFQRLQSVLCAHMAALTETCQHAGYVVKPWRGPQFCRSATCSVSGDPHYVAFDRALHHVMGTCTYTLTRVCQLNALENSFVVSTTSEFRGRKLEAACIKAIHAQVPNLRSSLIKDHKVVLNSRRVTLPVWPARGQVSIRPGGNFVLLYTSFRLQVCYDDHHLVDVAVPSSFAGRLCGLCRNYNSNPFDNNVRPDKRPAPSSTPLGASWKLAESSEPGPFSQCHGEVAPRSSFTSCVYGQCGSKGNALTLRASAHDAPSPAGLLPGTIAPSAVSLFSALKFPSGSSYSPCANPCPATCRTLNSPRDCPAALPCVEGQEGQKGRVVSRMSCVPLSQCGCTDQGGLYHAVGESWYTDTACCRLRTCSTNNNISCIQMACRLSCMCWPLDGLIHCRGTVAIRGSCTYVLAKVCHSTSDLPFFTTSGKNGKPKSKSSTPYVQQLTIDISGSRVTLQKGPPGAGKTWLSSGCNETCVCKDGVIRCQCFTCPSGSRCQTNSPGSGNLHTHHQNNAQIYGDPRRHTFDGVSYCFQGRKIYTLVKTMDMLPDGVGPLVVQGRNKVHFPTKPVFLQEIIVMVYGYSVQLQVDLDLVVSHKNVTIPYKPREPLRVIMRSHRLCLITDLELVVSFNGRDNAVIHILNTCGRLVRGLCGNHDGNQSSKYMLPGGTLTKNSKESGNSWEAKKITTGLGRISRTLEEKEGDEEDEPGFRVWECSPEQLELSASTLEAQACRVLPVTGLWPREPFQGHCVSDQRAARSPREQLPCQVLPGYVIICQETGATLAGWRDHTRCALVCPANTIYQSCMTPCPASCASLPGYVYSGAQSLPPAHCGCTYNGIYYQKAHVYRTHVRMTGGYWSREPTTPVNGNLVTGEMCARSLGLCHAVESHVRTSSQALYPHSPFPPHNYHSVIPYE
ncbi:hypothetical protein MC885_019449 [Smutsia gigantea]|nr:hypothetical protein MC885_019449 [Smutsia gigantea]